MNKKCSKCKEEKDISCFWRKKDSRDGLNSSCIECSKLVKKKYRAKNREKLRKSFKEYYNKNKQRVLEKNAKWAKKHPEKMEEYSKKYHKSEKRRIYIKEYHRNKYKNDINFRLRSCISSCIRRNLIGYSKKDSSIVYLDTSIKEYKEYLENIFEEGMSWDNYGDWHIHHIKPISLFDLSDERQIFEAFNFKNTRPLWAEENLKIGNKCLVSDT